jgi:hypothetical protein
MTHGKASSYKNGCRCDACREANRDWQRAYMHRTGRSRPRAVYIAERRANPPPHGTESRYTDRRCRCDECKRASATARRERRAADREAANAYDRAYRRRKAEAAA